MKKKEIKEKKLGTTIPLGNDTSNSDPTFYVGNQ
jgi:hypothetical protein